jgi:hypothetical protein
MKPHRVILVFAIIFSMKCFVSCIGTCPDPRTFDVIFTGVLTRTLDEGNYYSSVDIDSVYIDNFELNVLLQSDLQEVYACNNPVLTGFSNSYALSCVEDTYRYRQKVTEVQINAYNPKGTLLGDVSNSFGQVWGDNNVIYIPELVAGIGEYYRDFNVRIVEPETLPGSFSLQIMAYLDTGEILQDSTNLIVLWR